VLWLGDPDHLPVHSWPLDERVAYGTSDAGPPTVADALAVPADGATPLLAEVVDAAGARRTNRMGRVLAPMGVRYLIVQNQLAPTEDERADAEGLVPLLDVLAQQLDLQRVPVADGLTVYRNLAWAPTRSVLPAREGDRTSWEDADADDLRTATPVLGDDVGAVGAEGTVSDTGDLLVSSTSDDGWSLRVDGVTLRRTETYGWANQFDATREGEGVLRYDTPLSHRAAAVGQAVLWALAVVVWRRTRRPRPVAAPPRRGAEG
jgi:hypothetical protein